MSIADHITAQARGSSLPRVSRALRQLAKALESSSDNGSSFYEQLIDLAEQEGNYQIATATAELLDAVSAL